MIKDGFGQGYLFDNHWSATVMDDEEDPPSPPLLLYNHSSLFWSHLSYHPHPPAQLKVSAHFKKQNIKLN